MTTIEELVRKIESLSPQDRQEVEELVEKLAKQQGSRKLPLENSYGSLSDLNLPDLSLEEFQQARREMWSNFPRDLPSESK